MEVGAAQQGVGGTGWFSSGGAWVCVLGGQVGGWAVPSVADMRV